MKPLLLPPLAVILLAGCTEQPPETATDTHAIVFPEGQDVHFQDVHFQDVHFQDVHFQDVHFQGIDFSGGTYLGGSLVDVSAANGQLVGWRQIPGPIPGTFRWEQRFADKLCIWNNGRTVNYGCSIPAISPLAGAIFNAAFDSDQGEFTLQVRIGSGTGDAGAVTRDPTVAGHPLGGHAPAGACDVVTCSNPAKCRKNCDLWNYRLEIVEHDGEDLLTLCGPGAAAIALPGTWNEDGQHDPADPARFTFACTGGTIAKCTRWGYRPFGMSTKNCGAASCTAGKALFPMQGYHQACVRAAAAAYCGDDTSFTKKGTLIDISDFEPGGTNVGFLPRAANLNPNATALVQEAIFDASGANQLDHVRYDEVSLEDSCGELFEPGNPETGDDTQSNWNRIGPWSTPSVTVDSTTACAHSERTLGRWLHDECSACTDLNNIPPHCTDPHSPEGWDETCRTWANTNCPTTRMTTHSECTTGAALPQFATGCTLRVCLDPSGAHTGCCTGTWDASCVAAANDLCTGGREGPAGPLQLGFCGVVGSNNL